MELFHSINNEYYCYGEPVLTQTSLYPYAFCVVKESGGAICQISINISTSPTKINRIAGNNTLSTVTSNTFTNYYYVIKTPNLITALANETFRIGQWNGIDLYRYNAGVSGFYSYQSDGSNIATSFGNYNVSINYVPILQVCMGKAT